MISVMAGLYSKKTIQGICFKTEVTIMTKNYLLIKRFYSKEILR